MVKKEKEHDHTTQLPEELAEMRLKPAQKEVPSEESTNKLLFTLEKKCFLIQRSLIEMMLFNTKRF
jgi:hypothetical protein